MGEVYLAEDSRLRRRVALKLLPENLAGDPDRFLRFEREAFAASALNHPNILTIYEFGAESNTHFLASEYVQGETLRQRLRRGRLALTDALDIAGQIASALKAAHEAGIIHRDIKPENAIIREDGYVKVLDFGLAKLADVRAPETTSDISEDATRKQFQTQAGIIMGTVAYMSPEQARAQEVDARSDTWSLGCVLYEMLTGKQPFHGETLADMLANIIHRDPVSIRELRSDIAPELERITMRALIKNQHERYQTAQELLTDLKQLQKRLEFEAERDRTSATDSGAEAHTQIIHPQGTAQPEVRNSIAVLPFINLSTEADNEYFCDGLAEELLNALSKIDDLKVAARTSSFSFKGKNANVTEIGLRLGVKTVLEGSIRRSGNRLRITVQLVDAPNGYQLWSERYDRELKDIFDVQDEITLAIIDALKLRLFGDEKAALLKRYTDNAEAYQLYLKGRYCYNKYTPEYFRKGIEYFEQAIALEPQYAPAYAGLGFCYGTLFYSGSVAPHEIVPTWRALTDKALEIDDGLVDAYLSRASIEFYYDWDFAKAESDYQRAIELNPNSPDAHWRYGHFLANCERFDEAVKQGERAVELDPLSLVAQFFLSRIYLLARRPDEGFAQLRKMQEIEPNFAGAMVQLGGFYLMMGHYEEAIATYKKALTLGHFVVPAQSYLGAAYGLAGKREDAHRILDQLLEMRQDEYVTPFSFARIYAALGENDKAFDWFEKAFAERSGELVALKTETQAHLLGNTLIHDDRFYDLLRRIGMPMAQYTSSSAKAKIGSTEAETTSGTAKSRLHWVWAGLLVLVLLAAGFAGYRYFTSTKQIESIAVMPFVNASGDASVEYLSDGMTETLISALSRIPNLSVKARSTVFYYKGKETSPSKIGDELNVKAVLFGRVVQQGEDLRISLELVNTATQDVIWSEQYNGNRRELLNLQTEIARDVSQKLQTKLSGTEEQNLEKKYTSSPEAYELYLKGRYHWNRRTVEDDLKSLDYFNKAVKIDPGFALAYVGISDAQIMLGIPDAMAGNVSPSTILPAARAAADKAIELDPTLAEAYAARGHVRWKEFDWTGAESDFKRSIELNPNYSYVHLFYSLFLTYNGRVEEGLKESRWAVELDPYSIPIVANSSYVYSLARHYDEAIAIGRRAVEFDDTIPIGRQRLGIAYEEKGMLPEAIVEYKAAVEKSNRVQLAVASLAHAYAVSGNQIEARKLLSELEERSKHEFVSPYLRAIIHVALGERHRAIELLEEAYLEHSIDIVQAKADTKLDPLRGEPRFQDLIKKVGFPQ